MIVALIAASLAAHSVHQPHPAKQSAPCQAVPALCLASEEGPARLRIESGEPQVDAKMNAYRFNARPCRVIGNFGCPKQARLRLFRLGEPLRDTLARSFSLR